MKETAISMCRVSSDDQAKGYSLDIQKDHIMKHCSDHNIEIINTYREDYSAKNFNRPEYKKLEQFVKNNKGKINWLFVTTWDRFSRNISEALIIIDKFKKLGITVQAIQQPIDFSVPESRLILAMYLAMPEVDNTRRSIKIKEGMQAALKSGRWSNKAPRGYKNSRDGNNRPLIIPSSDAKYIKRAYDLIVKGFSQAEVKIQLNKEGYNIAKTTLSETLRNPVYIGQIRIKSIEGIPELIVDGLHEGIIEEETFFKVQDILNGRTVKRNTHRRAGHKNEFPLRGIICCEKCGGILTGSLSKGRNNRYAYYHCNHCGETRYSANSINSSMRNLLQGISFKESIKDIYDELLGKMIGKNTNESKKYKKDLEKEIIKLDTKLSNAQDMLLDSKIDHEDYANIKGKISSEKIKIEGKLNDLKKDGDSNTELQNQNINILTNILAVYDKVDIRDKLRLIGSIFPGKIIFDGFKYRTARINEVVRLMLLINNKLGATKNGQLSEFLELSGQVELKGIEPLTS